jgi:uncharacterized protein (DUF58 family)
MIVGFRPRRLALPGILLVLFLFTPLSILRLLIALYLLYFVIAVLYAVLAPRGLSVERLDEDLRVNRFQRFPVRLRVRNRGILPVHLFAVSDSLGGLFSLETGTFQLGLGPFDERILSFEAESHDRGEFAVGPVVLKGSDPFGIVAWRRRVEAPLRVIVYPAVHPLQLTQSTGLPSGNLAVASRLYEDVTNFRSVREYVAGDEMRRINWKVSARLGRLYAMEYVPSIYFPVLIVLNLTEGDYPVSHRQQLVERAIEVAASLVFHFVGIKQDVGLVTTGAIAGRAGFPIAPIRSGTGHAVNILEILARIGTSAEPVGLAEHIFGCGAGIRTGTKVMVVTPPLSEAQGGGLLRIRRRGYDTEVFFVSSYRMKKEDITLHGIRSRSVAEYGTELLDG